MLMDIELLIVTMNNRDYKKLLSDMNIQSNALIGNQTDKNEVEFIKYGQHTAKIYSFCEKGVGLNRNNILMRSQGDICVIADDDMIFKDNYEDIVTKYYNRYPEADLIIFNIDEDITNRYVTKKDFKVNYFNYFRFGAARITFKRKSVLFNSVYFNQFFGGGCKYSHGEDTIFLKKCLDANLNIIAVSQSIAYLKPSASTWFHGYTIKYFMDQGILFYALSKRYYKFFCLQDAIRHRRLYKKNPVESYRMMIRGIHDVKNK